MNSIKLISWFLSCLFILTFLFSCQKQTEIKTELGVSEGLKDRFSIPISPGVYAPKGLRKASLLEMLKLGETGEINAPFITRNAKGEIVGEDYYTSGPGPRYMQVFLDKNGKVQEGVIYEMTDEISALFTMMRFVK